MEFEHIEHSNKRLFKSFLVRIGHRTHHLHSQLEIICVLEGSITVDIGLDSFHLNSGDTLLINRYQIHSFESLGNNILLICQINPEMFSENISNIFFTEYLLKRDISNKIIRLMSKMHLETKSNLPSGEFFISGTINLIIATLLDNIPHTIPEIHTTASRSEVSSRLRNIIKYIENNFQYKITLDDLSSHMHLSKYYLSHFIKDNLGIGFQDFLNNIRLTDALRHLFFTNEKISVISAKSGFSDIKYLNTLIRKKYNCTAFALRKSMPKYDFLMLKSSDNSLHLPFDIENAINLLKKNSFSV